MSSDNLAATFFDSSLAPATPKGFLPGLAESRGGGPITANGRGWFPVASLVALGDCAAIAFASFVAGVATDELMSGRAIAFTSVLLAALVVGVFAERGLYGRTSIGARDLNVWSVLVGYLQGLSLFSVAIIVLARAIGGMPDPQTGTFWHTMDQLIDIRWLAVCLTFGMAGVVAWRVFWRTFGGTMAQRVAQRIVLVGDVGRGHQIMTQLRKFPGIHVVGLIDPAAGEHPRPVQGVRVFSTIDRLKELVRDDCVEIALISDGAMDASTLRTILDHAQGTNLDVLVAPRNDAHPTPTAIRRFGDLSMMEVRRRPLDTRASMLKRVEDLVIAVSVLFLILPVFGLIALAIRLDTKGPIFFRQPRVGLNGRVFEMIKFRSMHHNLTDRGAVQQTMRRDPRVTRVGAILRRHSLDELPQILNVLRGDMSIVGPRPHALAMTAAGVPLEEACREYPARFRVKPGITGWAQVNGWRGNVDTIKKLLGRVECDLYYIDHWSLTLDFKILLKTAGCVVSDESAF